MLNRYLAAMAAALLLAGVAQAQGGTSQPVTGNVHDGTQSSWVQLTNQGKGTGNLVITEVCDGTLPGGLPKWVQLTNVGKGPGTEIADLSIYSIGNYNNGGDFLGGGASTQLNAVSLAGGASYVIAYEFTGDTGCDPDPLISCFEFVYGSPPDQFIGPFTNGDDCIALFLGNATGDGSDACLIDIYGIYSVDGTGEPWDYVDGYSVRCGSLGTPGDSVYQGCTWFNAGPDSLETGNDAEELVLLQTLTTPFTDTGCVPNDGVGPVCGPVAYCPQIGDTLGCAGTMSASSAAMPVVGANDYTVTASGIQGLVNGLFFISVTKAWTSTAFGGGTLCIRPPLGRTTIGNSGGTSGMCDGSISFTVNEPGTWWGDFATSGTEFFIQGYYRDSGAVSGIAVTEAMYVENQ